MCVSTCPLVTSSEAQQALSSITGAESVKTTTRGNNDICVATNKGGGCVKLNSSRIHLDIGLSALQANIPSRLDSYSPCLIPYNLFQYKKQSEHAPCPYRKNDLLHAPDFAKVPIPINSRRQRNISLYKKRAVRRTERVKLQCLWRTPG